MSKGIKKSIENANYTMSKLRRQFAEANFWKKTPREHQIILFEKMLNLLDKKNILLERRRLQRENKSI